MHKLIEPNINFKYWAPKSPYFTDGPLLKSIKVGLSHANRAGLIDDVVQKKETMSNSDLVGLIGQAIHACDLQSQDDTCFLRAFDLIQGWGGKMCRYIYVQPKELPSRTYQQNSIARSYRLMAEELKNGRIQKALVSLRGIRYLGDSFATKHLYFWGKFSDEKTWLPICDTRMKALLYLSPHARPAYSDYITDLSIIAKNSGISADICERALFAFSSNWFENSKLILKKQVDLFEDQDEALRLSGLWESRKSFATP